jgi:WD40 repeat protein
VDSIPANLGLSDRKSFAWDGNSEHAEGANPGATVDVLSDGRVKFTAAGGTEILDPRASTFAGDARPRGSTPDGKVDSVFDPGTLWFAGEPTVVSVNSTGTTAAVGSSDGVVTELDLRPGEPALASRWTVSGQAAITHLGWSPDGGSLVVGTNRGEWFTPDSCAGCGSDLTKLLTAVSNRGWFCYPKEAVELFTPIAARSLGIRQCALPSVQAQQ